MMNEEERKRFEQDRINERLSKEFDLELHIDSMEGLVTGKYDHSSDKAISFLHYDYDVLAFLKFLKDLKERIEKLESKNESS